MNATKLAHILSVVPLLKEARSIFDMREVLRNTGIDVDDIRDYQFSYIRYCLDAFNGNRDYDLLRKYLADTVRAHRLDILGHLRKIAERIGENNISIKYDIGAAHEEYGNILNEVFVKGELHYVDKSPISIESAICGDVFDLDLPNNNETLYFMSEFLHCKRKNIELIDKFSKSWIIVNEVVDSMVDARLRMTGGKCLNYDELDAKGFTSYIPYKMNDMNYYLCFRRPDNDQA